MRRNTQHYIVLIIIAFGRYFFVKLLSKESSYVIELTKLSPFINILNSNQYPLLFRLTDEFSVPFKHSERIYSFHLEYWVLESNEKFQEKNYIIQLGTCDINKNSGKYKSLFESLLILINSIVLY